MMALRRGLRLKASLTPLQAIEDVGSESIGSLLTLAEGSVLWLEWKVYMKKEEKRSRESRFMIDFKLETAYGS